MARIRALPARAAVRRRAQVTPAPGDGGIIGCRALCRVLASTSGNTRQKDYHEGMDRRTVLTKTAKGLMEVTGKTSLLAREHRGILSQVDGKATVGDIHQKLDRFSENKLLAALGKLAKAGFARQIVSAPARP